MSQKVVVSAEQLASLFEHSRNAGTLTAWCAAAIQWAHDAEAQGIQLVSDIAAVKRERDELREALRELVRLKDLHDRIDKYERMLSDQPLDEYLQERADYKRGKPLAWAKARAILAAGSGT